MPQITLQQAFDTALQHHQAGRLREAEHIYRQILELQPDYPPVLHLLGVLAAQAGRNDVAIDFIRRAIARFPQWPEALSNLGNALRNNGQLAEAVTACRQALALKPDFPEALSNLGAALRQMGHPQEAIAAFRQALVLKPDYPDALSNLGTVLHEQGCLDEAVAALGQAIAQNPNFPEAHNNLGNALKDCGQLDDAIAAYRRAIALNPDYPEAHSNLGNALRDCGQLDAAIAACRRAIDLKPGYADAFNNLGTALTDAAQLDAAIAACRQAIILRPDFPEAHSNLGHALTITGQLDEAVASCRQAIALKPDYPDAHNNLGTALKDNGRLDDAIAAYRQALALRPGFTQAHSNLVFALNYHPAFDAPAIGEELRQWNRVHAEPLHSFIQPHPNDRDPGRRLRIGYVSADFWAHASAFFLIPLLEHHDPRQVELYYYAQVFRPDETSRRMQQTGQWRNVVRQSDEQLARQIREDRIDILIDLKLHTSQNRLLVFARKPAPVQVTWLGYPGSTGLSAIDYRLTDPCLDPPGIDESVYAEHTLRLPDTFWCYDPLEGRDIPINPLPARESGAITFGSLNNFCKLNPATLTLWAAILRQVENSRLLLAAPEGSSRRQLIAHLRQEGIDPARLEFAPRLSRPDYLKLYHRIDLGLDTFPYNGHTTSLDSFWMGVPVITRAGSTPVSRAGLCQLSNLGLPELTAHSPEEFMRIAVDLAKNLPRLAQLRQSLRTRMEQSPLMDAPRFTHNVEQAYRKMWQKWCDETRREGL